MISHTHQTHHWIIGSIIFAAIFLTGCETTNPHAPLVNKPTLVDTCEDTIYRSTPQDPQASLICAQTLGLWQE
jgi:PBP1b-binding outer membrane lipoprotein LpoB